MRRTSTNPQPAPATNGLTLETVRPFTPEELSEAREPKVEDRLNTAESALALATLLSTAMSHVDDLGLSADVTQPAWTLVSNHCHEGLTAIWSAMAALPPSAIGIKAPARTEAE